MIEEPRNTSREVFTNLWACNHLTTMEWRNVGEPIASVSFRCSWVRSPKPYFDEYSAQNPIDSFGCCALVPQHPHSVKSGGRYAQRSRVFPFPNLSSAL